MNIRIRPETFNEYLARLDIDRDDFFAALEITEDYKQYAEREKEIIREQHRKARRILARMQIVERFDIWDKKRHNAPKIGKRPWSRKRLNRWHINEVRRLYRRKSKLLSVLTDLYHYLAFGQIRNKNSNRYNITFTGLRKQWEYHQAIINRRRKSIEK